MEKYLKTALYGMLGIFLYFLLYSIESLPFKLLHIDLNTLSNTIKIIYMSVYEIMIIAIMLLIYNKWLKKDLNDIKKNHKEYYSKYFKYYLIAFGVMMISNLIIIIILNKDISTNETLVRETFQISPFYMYLSGIIFAPIVEEIVFRGCIKKIIPNKYLFVLTSGLICGFIHIAGYINSPSDYLYLIPYSSLGFAFAYVYYKTDNIFTSMGLHFMHNGILLSLQFITLFL